MPAAVVCCFIVYRPQLISSGDLDFAELVITRLKICQLSMLDLHSTVLYESISALLLFKQTLK